MANKTTIEWMDEKHMTTRDKQRTPEYTNERPDKPANELMK